MQNKKGFSIIEVILAGSILAIIVFGVVSAWLYGEHSLIKSGDRSRGVAIASEGIEIARNLRDYSFDSLKDGSYALSNNGSGWSLAPNEKEIIGNFKRIITVQADGNSAKKITSTVEWTNVDDTPGAISSSTILTNWGQAIVTGKKKKQTSVNLAISDVVASPSLFGVTITWTTNKAASSRVEYGQTSSYGTTTSETDTSPRVTEHAIAIGSLSPDTIYHFRVKSIDSNSKEVISTDYNFTTSADATEPEISNIDVTVLVTYAMISWDTDEASTTFIDHGLSDPPGTTTTEVNINPRVVHHDVELVGLNPETTYYYKIHSRDASNNEGTSDVLSFTTTGYGPEVSNLTVVERKTTYITLSWTTNEPSDAQIINLNPPQNTSPVVDDSPMTLSHEVTISGLTPCLEYSLHVRSYDPEGNAGGETINLITKGCPPSILENLTPQIFTISKISIRPWQSGDAFTDVYAINNTPDQMQISSFRIGESGFNDELFIQNDQIRNDYGLHDRFIDIVSTRDYLITLDTSGSEAYQLAVFDLVEDPHSPNFIDYVAMSFPTDTAWPYTPYPPKTMLVKDLVVNGHSETYLFIGFAGQVKVFDLTTSASINDPNTWDEVGQIDLQNSNKIPTEIYLEDVSSPNVQNLLVGINGGLVSANIYNGVLPAQFTDNVSTPVGNTQFASNGTDYYMILPGQVYSPDLGILNISSNLNDMFMTHTALDPKAISKTTSQNYVFVNRDTSGTEFEMLIPTGVTFLDGLYWTLDIDDDQTLDLSGYFDINTDYGDDIGSTIEYMEGNHEIFFTKGNKILIIDPSI